MTQTTTEAAAASFVNLLAARVAFLTQRLHSRMGVWKVHIGGTGSILAMSQCGLGDAGFLPQALRHGGLELHRFRPSAPDRPETPPTTICIGEIRWPVDPATGKAVVVPSPQAPLDPDAAAPQTFSILIHASISSARVKSSRFHRKLQGWVADIEDRLACRWWSGIGSTDAANAQPSTLNLHLSTRQDEPLTPYEFEARVLPLLKQAARFTRQHALVLRFDNPSPNYLVYCASQDAVLPKGQPCAEGYRHPE